MAVKTSTQTGVFSDGATWGGTAPVAGDTVVIANTHVVTINVATPVLGSNASAVGHGVTVASGGKLVVGATLNADGFNTTTNRAVQVDAGGTLERASGGNIVVTPASSWQTVINNDGDFLWNGGTIESGEPWTFVERGRTVTNYVPAKIKQLPGVGFVWVMPIDTTSVTFNAAGPLSNAAGTSVGTAEDNSFVVTATTNPVGWCTQRRSSFDTLVSLGDYYVDCPNSVVYYVSDSNRITGTYTCKTHKWHGFGIQSARSGDSKFLVQNATFRRMGGNFGSHDSESINTSQRAVFMDRRVNGAVTAAREGYVRSCTFEYCVAPLQAYNSTNTQANPLDLSGNTYKYIPVVQGNMNGTVFLGYASHVKCDDSIFDMLAKIGSWWGRGAIGVTMRRLTGMACCDSILGTSATGSIVEDCNMTDTGSMQDAGGFQVRGNAANGPNIYRRNKLTYGNRCGRVGSFMTIEDNEFVQFQHHGFVAPASAGFFTGIKIKNNIIRDVVKTGDMGGGWTLGYNYTQWMDDVEIEGNTFDTGNRSIMFNDQEGTKVLGTRLKIWNNNLTNAHMGITQPTNTTSDQTKKQVLRLDYNNKHGMTNAGNVKQGTPVMSAAEYNLTSGRNVKGIALFNPSANNTTGKALTLVVSGTPGTDFSMLLSWGGGTAVELVSAQGTATGGTAATGHAVPGTIVDSGKSWTTDAVRLDQGKIVSGTGSGQHFMVRTNNATTLTVMPNVEAGTFTAPASGSVYIVLKSDVQLSDGAQTVEAGLYILEVPLTVGTYTDTGITFESNALAVDPLYVSATNLTPTNLTLATSGFGGTYIGAKEPVSADNTAPNLTLASCTATGPTTATGLVTTDDGNGTLYFLASTNATETATTVKAALSQSVTAAGEQTISLSGLDADTTYYLHFVQINGASLESGVVSTAAWATPEVPPVVYPIIHAVAGSSDPRSVTCTVTTDTPGGVIYGLLNTDPLPPQAGIITSAPTDTESVILAGEYTLGADELDPRTTYYWHVIHVDGDDLASNVVTIPVTTLDISIALSLSNTAPAKLQYVLVTSDMGITAAEIESLWGLT
jgi:hypothetical protein